MEISKVIKRFKDPVYRQEMLLYVKSRIEDNPRGCNYMCHIIRSKLDVEYGKTFPYFIGGCEVASMHEYVIELHKLIPELVRPDIEIGTCAWYEPDNDGDMERIANIEQALIKVNKIIEDEGITKNK